MNVVLLIQFSLLVLAQCYARNGFDPLRKFLEVQRSKNSFVKYVSEDLDLTVAYSPVYVGAQNGLKDADKISMLPGQPIRAKFNQYSGYVTVDPGHGRALFYYFAESRRSSHRPLVLWLNGGPGCSSMFGAMMELGPFRVNKDGKTLSVNKYSWNKAANVLFLESPAGVGFSYSNTSTDYVNLTGDSQTAKDTYTFLVNWLERFPEYKMRDFYITGESYAGHYIPQLAHLILKRNKHSNHTVINLKGIAIGNAYVDDETLNKGVYDFFWSRSIISDEIHQGIVSNCDFSWNKKLSDACKGYLRQESRAIGNIYAYDIYASLCQHGTSTATSGFDPCFDNYIHAYLNMPEVQKSLHASVIGLPGRWQDCNDKLYHVWKDQPFTVLPTIQQLMGSGISIWLYSGDTDGQVPVTTTKYSIEKLKTSVKTPWYPWYLKQEVGGFVVEYDNLTFATVRGSGHYVPGYQPARGLALFSSFLAGKLPPTM